MPGARHKILGHVFSGFCTKMNRTKQLSPADENMETPLKRCLNTFDITLLGIGHMVGAGIYVLTGTVARDLAGPGIVLSFLLAGMTSMLAALCYAEFGTRVPKAGSAYVYTYVSIGEFWAFVIGWNILLEHMIVQAPDRRIEGRGQGILKGMTAPVSTTSLQHQMTSSLCKRWGYAHQEHILLLGAASVARAWSGYIDSILGGVISNYTVETVGELHEELLGRYPDFLAFAVCLSYTCILALGVKGSAMVNSMLTLVNLAVMILVVVVGFYYADLNNWTTEGGGFLPFGLSGVVAGAATCFYAFVGFDSIATSGEEAQNPSFSIPVATIVSMTLVCIGYILVSGALTLMVPYWEISPTAALPEAFATLNLPWAKYAVTVGALCGMTTTLLGSLFALPRCMYAMAADGLIFSFLGKVNKTTQVPLINLAVSGLSSAIIALLFDLEKLVEFMSIGTLLAYTIVSASVIILRYRPEVMPLLREDSTLSEAATPTSGVIEFGVGPAGRLKANYSWLEPVVGRCEPGAAVSSCVFVFSCFGAALCLHLHWTNQDVHHGTWWTVLLTAFFISVLFACLVIIHAHEQNKTGLGFTVPLVPTIPAISILSNIQLMVHLNTLTWMRFMIWMAFGLLVYFLYGIHHSKENDTATSYSVLLTSNEAGKVHWGSIGGSKRRSASEDTKPIVDEEEVTQ